LIATDQGQKIAPLIRRLIADCERAALEGDADWFRRQAKAIEKGGSKQRAQRAQFNAKVVYLLEHAWSETLGRPENWRRLSDAEREAFPNLRRVPHVVTFTPAGKFTDATASHIWKTVVDDAWEEPETQSLVKQQFAAAERFGLHKASRKKKRQTIEEVVAERYGFKIKEHAVDAIHDLAKRFRFALKKQPRKC
jgi:hypothetical protein